MTNPTKLLPRFASASQWLAEHHPDAPRLPEWIQQLSNGGWVVIGNEGYGYDENDCETFQDNPDACLAGAVVWAMEVADWVASEQMGWCDVRSNPLAVERERFGNLRLEVFICDHKRNIDHSDNGSADTPTEAWLLVLESICTALGREG